MAGKHRGFQTHRAILTWGGRTVLGRLKGCLCPSPKVQGTRGPEQTKVWRDWGTGVVGGTGHVCNVWPIDTNEHVPPPPRADVEKSGLSWQGGAAQEDVGVPWNERHLGES